jgi:hypothetical protein
VFEWVEVVLNINRRALLDRAIAKKGVGSCWNLHEVCENPTSCRKYVTLTLSAALGLGDTAAEAALELGETCQAESIR